MTERANDETPLAPCAPDIYRSGTLLMTTHTIPAAGIEAWVRKVAQVSEQPVDWHYVGGRACIFALGNLERVREAIQTLLPEHDELQREAVLKLDCGLLEWQPSCTLYGPDEWNPAHEFIRQANVEKRE